MSTKELNTQLSREASSTAISEVLQIAERRRDEYKKAKYFNKHWYYTSQSAIIVLAGITPLLLLMKLPPVFPAISSAVASITAGLASNFKFREKYDIHVKALDDIELELDNFRIGTGIYGTQDDEKKKNLLMLNIDTIHRNRRSIWSGMINGSPSTEDTSRMHVIGSDISPPKLPGKPLEQ